MINLNYLNSLFLAAFLCLGSNFAVAQSEPQVIDKVVALIGEKIVLLSDIEGQIDQMTLSDIPVNENTVPSFGGSDVSKAISSSCKGR